MVRLWTGLMRIRDLTGERVKMQRAEFYSLGKLLGLTNKSAGNDNLIKATLHLVLLLLTNLHSGATI